MSYVNRLGEVTLRDFKASVDREGNYRYHFKALDPEFGTVKEEVLPHNQSTGYFLVTFKDLNQWLTTRRPGPIRGPLPTFNYEGVFKCINIFLSSRDF